MIGKIKTVMTEKGFGFIIGDDLNEYFFHSSSCLEFSKLKSGKKVEFDPTSSPKGKRAENVSIVV